MSEDTSRGLSKLLSRRSLLHTAVVGGVAVAGFHYFDLLGSAPTKRNSLLEPELFEFISGEQRFSRRLGALYEERLASEGVAYDELSLQRDILSDTTSLDGLGERLRAKVHRELISGNTIAIDGWDFPVTELKLSLLAYVINGRVLSNKDKSRQGSLDELPLAQLGEVEDWGPDSTVTGVPFNEQPNGNSALWFKISGLQRGISYAVFFGSVQMKSTVHFEKGLITADLYSDQARQQTANVGKVPVYLVDVSNYQKQQVGEFEVFGGDDLPKQLLPITKRLKITAWGPRQGIQGLPFNPQPDGSAAFWLKYDGHLDSSDTVYLGDVAMNTTHHFKRKLITAAVSADDLNGFDFAGELPVSIRNKASSSKVLVGKFVFKKGQ